MSQILTLQKSPAYFIFFRERVCGLKSFCRRSEAVQMLQSALKEFLWGSRLRFWQYPDFTNLYQKYFSVDLVQLVPRIQEERKRLILNSNLQENICFDGVVKG